MNFLADAQACEPQPRQRVDLVHRRVANRRAVFSSESSSNQLVFSVALTRGC